MRFSVLCLFVIASTSLMAGERITSVGKAELKCQSGLTCVLTYSDADTLLRNARAQASLNFENTCSGTYQVAVGPFNTVETISCSTVATSATCTVTLVNDCNLENSYEM